MPQPSERSAETDQLPESEASRDQVTEQAAATEAPQATPEPDTPELAEAPAEEAAPAEETTESPAEEPPAVEEAAAETPVEEAAQAAAEEEPADEASSEAPAEETPAAADPAEESPAQPAAPLPGVPTPAMFAARKPAAPRPASSVPTAPASPDTSAAVAEPLPPSESVRHGRVGEDGTVYVQFADGTERAVGSYPGATADEALAYFARKYDELVAAADLLKARLASTDVSSHDARQSLNHLKEQIGEANVVGDLAALEATVTHLEGAISDKARAEQQARAAAKAQATQEREAIVAQAEQLAATDPSRIQWKQSSARVRELLDEWKAHQRSGPRLDKDVESGLWQRFSAARSSFDKARKTWFAQLDDQHAEAKRLKERLVAEAEQLATSKDWGATAGAFKRLMQDWKRAGRASRTEDDALWQRFKSAQDAFFNAKDEVVAAEEAEFTENLKVKEALLAEAEALTVDEANLEHAKNELRRIQDRWEAAGKVPRADVRRVEGRLRAVEQQVRDLEDKKWQRTDPELTARAQSMVDQLERQVQGLESDLAAARAAGDDKRASSLESEIATKKLWLDSARGGLS
ncbi:DUF349 domain-containing protein [Ornithinimicrobium sufpigmenti]|uniref:DUF349 domain-containing protein n=1 Tax=Ornithinimicrobium sufpigmenti TaxID=2508882 RepID=UPI001EE05D64|nr:MULTISPECIES: DUF349 domain-containing protein [unclassified Ornithinimicrobium]